MNKKNLFRLLAALALSLSLCAGAMAEGSAQTVVWRVTEAEIATFREIMLEPDNKKEK